MSNQAKKIQLLKLSTTHAELHFEREKGLMQLPIQAAYVWQT